VASPPRWRPIRGLMHRRHFPASGPRESTPGSGRNQPHQFAVETGRTPLLCQPGRPSRRRGPSSHLEWTAMHLSLLPDSLGLRGVPRPGTFDTVFVPVGWCQVVPGRGPRWRAGTCPPQDSVYVGGLADWPRARAKPNDNLVYAAAQSAKGSPNFGGLADWGNGPRRLPRRLPTPASGMAGLIPDRRGLWGAPKALGCPGGARDARPVGPCPRAIAGGRGQAALSARSAGGGEKRLQRGASGATPQVLRGSMDGGLVAPNAFVCRLSDWVRGQRG
jgi:hypothetical protein